MEETCVSTVLSSALHSSLQLKECGKRGSAAHLASPPLRDVQVVTEPCQVQVTPLLGCTPARRLTPCSAYVSSV